MKKHLDKEELERGLSLIQASPSITGTLDLIVRRPDVGEREKVGEGILDTEQGLVGDNWLTRGNRKIPDGSANSDMQLNLMNSRAIALMAQKREFWQLAGDQLFVDFNLSYTNVPPGTRLSVGEAVIEVTAEPHLGCKKFSERFGHDAAMFVNSDVGKSLNLRGINARVIKPGIIKIGSKIERENA